MELEYPKLQQRKNIIWISESSLDGVFFAANRRTWLSTSRELNALGWKVTIISTSPVGSHQIEGVDTYGLSRPEIYLLRHIVFNIKMLAYVIKHWETTDILLFHVISSHWLLILYLYRQVTGKKSPLFVLDTRTLPMAPLDKESLKDKLRRWVFKTMRELSYSWTDGQVAITHRIADVLRIPDHKLWGVWPSGVDLETFNTCQANRKWPSNEDSIHLIYIGSMHYERNLTTLSRAVITANAEGMDFTLSLVGFGNQRDELVDYAAAFEDQIRVPPPVPPAQVPGLLTEAHIGVLPFPDEDKFRVSSPIKLFEYMAAGLPVLATDIVCHTDVVGNGKYVFWAKGSDEQALVEALKEIWESRGRLEEMGLEAANAAKLWTWEESARKLSHALESGYSQIHTPIDKLKP